MYYMSVTAHGILMALVFIGAALAILFGANMRGNLEVCDCKYPRGGLARRVGYVEAFSSVPVGLALAAAS